MSSSRLVQIDSLRGMFLVMMMIDHLLLWPFDFWPHVYKHTYGLFGFFSAAEGFFFISGLLAGIILSTKPHMMLDNLSTRLKKLYVANLACLVAIALLAFFMPTLVAEWKVTNTDLHLFLDHPFLVILLGSLFLYLPPFFDILPVYFAFFCLLPLIYRGLKEKKVIMLLLVSFSVWALGQFLTLEKLEALVKTFLPFVCFGFFDIFCWQLLFTVAVICGYYYAEGKLIFLNKPQKKFFYGALIFCLFCFLARHGFIFSAINWKEFVDIPTLDPLRLLNFFAAAYVTALVLNKNKIFNVPLLAKLGQNSLKVFLYHSCLIYLLGAFVAQIRELSTGFKVLIFAASIISLWLPVLFSSYWTSVKNFIKFFTINVGKLYKS